MKTAELKIARIGNSRGVRLPAPTLRRYQIGESVLMEERSDGILLRSTSKQPRKLSWEETAAQMAAESENWEEWDVTLGDGLDAVIWAPNAGQVADKPGRYKTKTRISTKTS
jgi:antitoxin component of MazEF toxin-antitoxin module